MSERRFGILIASSRFPDESELEDLRCPVNDVDGLYEVLMSEDRGGFTETIVLKNQPHHEVLKQINRVLKKAQKNDLVLIFYSGHGRLDLAGRLYLTTVDTEIETLEATSIPVNNIIDYIDVSPSKKSVLLLDCCYSGAVKKTILRGGVQEQLQQASGGRGVYILTGSTAVQVAQEKESDQYGLFSKHVIEGIEKGDADRDGDGLITMDDLYGYVHKKVLEEGPQEPMRWAVGVRGDLIISRSGKTPRKERGKQIREILGELWTRGVLPGEILDKARKVSALTTEEISGENRAYDDLLDQLVQKKIEVGAFISKWYKMGQKTPISIPEKPVPKSTEPKPDKPGIAETKALKPEPDKGVTAGSVSPEPLKTRNSIKFSVVAVVLVVLSAGMWWWFSQQQTKDVRQEMAKIKAVEPVETQKTVVNRIGMKFVWIPPGKFIMGSPENEFGRDDDERQHWVTLTKGFYMQTTEVTQEQWQRVMGENPSYFKECGDNCPVEQVSWDDTQAFIVMLNKNDSGKKYRLPTEAEWEYACRAGTTSAFSFGGDAGKLGEYAWYEDNSKQRTYPVGTRKPNPWGLYDMHGNAWEWCRDWYGNYPVAEVIDPKGFYSGAARVLRGGSFYDPAEDCRAAFRIWDFPVNRDGSHGFRLVLLPGQQ